MPSGGGRSRGLTSPTVSGCRGPHRGEERHRNANAEREARRDAAARSSWASAVLVKSSGRDGAIGERAIDVRHGHCCLACRSSRYSGLIASTKAAPGSHEAVPLNVNTYMGTA